MEKTKGETMKNEPFVLERKNRYIQTDQYPRIHIGKGAYAKLADMARESGLTIAEIANMAVDYAAKNLVYVDEA